MAKLVHAGEFATEGERAAAAELQKLPAHWVIICNKTLPLHSGTSYELDFVIISDNRVFLLDEKSWRGGIRGNDQFWVRADGSSTHSPLGKADYVAKVLAGHIRTKVPPLETDRRAFVHGGVLLSAAAHLPVLRDEPRAQGGVFLLGSVVKKLLQADQQGGTPLVAQFREQIRTCLYDLSDRPQVPQHIGLYTVQELVAEKMGARIFDAVMEGDEHRTLMVYELGLHAPENEELHTFYLRQFEALRTLRDTGLVPDVQDPFPWSDDYLVLPISPLAGKSLSALATPETREELATELAIAEAAFRGLAKIHEAHIIHRALGPDAVYVVGGGQQPKVAFTNFYAARVGTHSIAVSLDAFAIQDPYAAPELVHGYSLATAASDTFSLALTFLERISRLKFVDIRPTPGGPVVVPQLADTWANVAPRDDMEQLTDLLREVLNPPQGKALTAADIVEFIADLAKRLRVAAAVEEHRILDSRYRVKRVLGEGANARTYLVTDTLDDHLYAVKQLLRPSQDYEDAKKEWNALRDISSPRLPRIFDIYAPQSDVHVKMEYIPGPTLHDVTNEFPWSLDRWRALARQLLDAVAALEDKGILHRDIKPTNIILDERTGDAVLIDFGFAVPRDRPAQTAGSLPFLPREALSADRPPPTSDLYAVATVLYHVLTGQMPVGDGVSEDDLAELAPLATAADTATRLAAVLQRARSPDVSQRPATSRELLHQLEEAFRALPAVTSVPSDASLAPLTNPWVGHVRGLFRNSVVGNADNRGLDSEFVRQTYVPTSLDRDLLPALIAHRPRALFLSGNPGDGKTAFLEQVRLWLEQHGGTQLSWDASGWEWSYQSHVFRACYDASEAHNGRSADEQLIARLAGLEGASQPPSAVTVLVAINDGRLEDFFSRHAERFGWLGKQVRGPARRTKLAETAVWVMDLKQRAFVQLPGADAPSVAARVLGRLLDPDQWNVCDDCSAKGLCPIRGNALALQQPPVSDRLQQLLLLTHLRHQHHTTMRDLRSTFAYVITGNLDCQDVHTALAAGDRGASLIDRAYWRTAFAPIEPVEELLGDTSQLDPARFPQPRLDRFLHFHQAPSDATARASLFRDGHDLPPQRFYSEREWLAAMKRRLYFELAETSPVDGDAAPAAALLRSAEELLPYRYAAEFLRALTGQADLYKLKRRLALGILRSDGINISPTADHLGIKVNASEEHQLIILKQFPLDHFILDAPPKPTGDMNVVEAIPEVLRLRVAGSSQQLTINLGLFEQLMRFADGLQPTAPEFQPLLEDLVPFKSALLLSESRELVLVESGRHVHHITQAGGKVVRRTSDRS